MRFTLVPMLVILITMLLHVPFCYLFVYKCDLGIRGIAIATTIKDGLGILLVSLWGACCSPEISSCLASPFLGKDSFRGWCQYLKVSLPSTVMLAAEMWAFEILGVMAGTIGVTELAC